MNDLNYRNKYPAFVYLTITIVSCILGFGIIPIMVFIDDYLLNNFSEYKKIITVSVLFPITIISITSFIVIGNYNMTIFLDRWRENEFKEFINNRKRKK